MKKIRKSFVFTILLFSTFTFLLTNINGLHEHVEAASYDPTSGAIYYADADKYYQGIDPSLTGEDLVVALSSLTSEGFVTHSYSSLPDIYQYSDLSNGMMRMVYTGTEKSFSSGSMPGSTNKEHVWPASWYGTGDREEGAGSPGADAHNVWPSASDLNSKRGSCAFDELDFATSWKCSEFGSYSYGTANDNDSYVWSTAFNNSNGQNDDAMYPSEGHRGEIARILMYVATRYHNDTRYPVMLHDKAITLKSGRIGKLSTLLKWHYLEPPTEWEINRNNEVATRWHHNRNPFVDNPEYATLIYQYLPEPDQNAPTDAVLDVIEKYGNIEYDDPQSIEVNTNDIAVATNQEYQIVASVLPSTAKQKVGYRSLDTNIATVTGSGVVKGVAKGSTTIEVYAIDDSSIKTTINVSVKELVYISLEGKPYKTTYYTNDTFEPDGLLVKGQFSDDSETTIDNAACQWLDGVTGTVKLATDTTSIRCVYQGLTAIYNGITVIKRDVEGYEKLTDKMDDYSGRYLLVNDTYGKALDGSVSLNKTNSSNQFSVSIENDIINGDYFENEFIVTSTTGGYTLSSRYGQTFGASSTGNFQAGNYINTIEAATSGTIIKCGNLTLRYNANYFRYYSRAGQGDPIFLYRYIDSGEPDVGLKEAKTYAENFNSSNLCGTDNYTKASADIWKAQKEAFESLPNEAKTILKNGIANQYSSNPIETCLARYDRVVFLYGADSTNFPDYMDRNEAGVFAINNITLGIEKNVAIAVVLIVASISGVIGIICLIKFSASKKIKSKKQ